MQKGFVALLDVLGFSSLIAGNGEGEHLHRYLACLEEALDDEAVGPKVDYVVFSDSIVLTTHDDSESALQAILLRCSRALGLMLQSDIPLRGAIACGTFFRSSGPSGVFVAGRAILDAYHFETVQDWVGIMLAPSTVKRVPDLAKRCELSTNNLGSEEAHRAIREQISWTAFVQPCHSIPFHGSHPSGINDYSGYAIVPTDGVPEPAAISDSIGKSMESLAWLQSLAPNPSAQWKYQRSSSWLSVIRANWQSIVMWENRLRTLPTANKPT